jgi:hypothetical protein
MCARKSHKCVCHRRCGLCRTACAHRAAAVARPRIRVAVALLLVLRYSAKTEETTELR